ncbi:MAG: UvrD-helicase domain-containing protein, partial [Oscillospiraceae bacterium]|nr:UvrD-helicase domain-containing protein [Oscillospiraceae bacterium]
LCAGEPAVPWAIIAITFTNKAAGELKERLERMCGPAAKDIWAATFHRACIRILRRDIEKLDAGFTRNFTIYDSSDSQRVIKDIVKSLGLNEKEFQPRAVLSIISSAKDKNQLPDEFAQEAQNARDWRMPRVAQIYAAYDRRLREANAMDFDDIILHTVHLLQKDEEVRTYYQEKFRYVLIDEYQDTNHVQYLLAKLLAGGRNNICVVGDDDQSIYRFRGANIENILNFETQYDTCRTIRLEQNYRSTQNILDAANEVIRNNAGRKGKTLWTDSGAGEKVLVKVVFSESDEANFVANQIMDSYGKGGSWKDNAVLYRMNAQSNVLEMALKQNGIPYKVYGGLKFFDRAEIKDVLAYLCVVDNPADDLRLRRIVNVPARGIGGTSLEKLAQIAGSENVSLFDVMERVASYPALRTAAAKITAFVELVKELRRLSASLPLPELYDAVCDKSGYVRALEEKKDMESRGRIENVQELRSSVINFLETVPDDPSLAGFLDSVALYTDMDDVSDSDNCVTLMTMHSAKGLEFPNVYVVGMEEGVFPGSRVIGEGEELEEERRLCYVAMTRARERLVMTATRQRTLYGHTNNNPVSRFLNELPPDGVEWQRDALPAGLGSTNTGSGGPSPDFRTQNAGAAGESYLSRKRRMPRPPRDPGFTAEAPVQDSELLRLEAGDTVQHQTFGKGMVLSVRPMGNDALVEIAFDDVGTKKLMLRKAAQRMSKL